MLAFTNKAALNIHWQIFVVNKLSFLLDKDFGVETLDHQDVCDHHF